MGLSIISVFSNLILVPDHPRINYIFISKVIGTHVEFYVNPFYCINFSGNNLSVFQQVCFADVCNPCYPDHCDSNKPRSYECPDSNLLIGDRNQKSNKNPNSTKNMEQIFRKELMDFFMERHFLSRGFVTLGIRINREEDCGHAGKISQPKLIPMRFATVRSSQPSGILRVLPAISSRRLEMTWLFTRATVTPYCSISTSLAA